MTKVSELAAQQMNAAVIANTWGTILYNVRAFGLVDSNGNVDPEGISFILKRAQNDKVKLFFPSGTYYVDDIQYGTIPYANQISIEGADRNTTILKKRTADGKPLFVIGSADGTNFTANISIRHLTFQGIPGNTPAAMRTYDLVRSKIEDCRFTGALIGLDMQGGIANTLRDCVIDYNNVGYKLTKFTSKAGGGYPNLNSAHNCQFVDNAEWGVYFDDGRLLNLDLCEVEGNGTAGNSNTGGLYVGANIGSEGSLFDIGVNVEGAWFEANNGDGAVQLNYGRNSFRGSYFVANTGTYDVHVKGGKYNLEFCDGDTVKANNLYEESTVMSGNYISDCDLANLSYDNAKTTVTYSNGRILSRQGEVPVTYGVAKPFEQCGIDTTASGVVNVVFPVAFAAAPTSVQVTMNNNSTGTLDVPEVYNVTATGFTVRKKSMNSGSATVGTTNAGFYWRAIGQR